MFRITKKGIVAVVVAAVAGSLVAVAGSFVATGGASAAVTPVHRQVQPAARYLGEASLDDRGVLTLDVNQVVAARGAQALLVGREATLLTGPATRITSVQGGLLARTLLDHAIVRVQGRLLSLSAWTLNDEGERVPTIRASQITVVQLEAEDETDTETAPSQDTTDAASQD